MHPKVSVIIPVYNVENYLRQCLDSVMKQTLKEIEIICVDDGSTDCCPEILNEYKSIDARIKVIHKENTGYGDTMNVGLRNAQGEYVGIVESDDFADLDMFEKLYKVAEENNVDVVKSNYFNHTSKNGDQFFEFLSGLPYDEVFQPKDRPSIFLLTGQIWSGIYKSEFLQKNDILFNNTPGASYQDHSFSFKLWYCAETVILVKDAFLHYRSDNPMSSVQSPRKLNCFLDEYNEINRFIASKGTKIDAINAILTKLKYNTCLFTYFRVASPFQYYSLKKASDYFLQMQKEGRFDDSLLTKPEKNTLNDIMYHCDEYFEKTCKAYHDERLDLCHTINQELYADGFNQRVLNATKICIYGAGKVAQKVSRYLFDLGIEKKRIIYVVTYPDTNSSNLMEIPIKGIEEIVGHDSNALFVVSVSEKSMLEIVRILERHGVSDIIVMENKLRNVLHI